MEENLKILNNYPLSYLNIILNIFKYIMFSDRKWLLMTYYCPTHGSVDRFEPLQIRQNELKRVKSEYHDQLTKNS